MTKRKRKIIDRPVQRKQRPVVWRKTPEQKAADAAAELSGPKPYRPPAILRNRNTHKWRAETEALMPVAKALNGAVDGPERSKGMAPIRRVTTRKWRSVEKASAIPISLPYSLKKYQDALESALLECGMEATGKNIASFLRWKRRRTNLGKKSVKR